MHAAQHVQLLLAESIVVVALQNGRLQSPLPGSPVKSVDYWIEVSFHNEWKVVQGQTNPMVSQTTLRKIVGTDTHVAHATADLSPTLIDHLTVGLFFHELIDAGSQHLESLLLVLQLGPLILA